MAYLCEPHPGQQVFVDQQAGQTQLICQRRQPGQRQEARSSFSTGTWTQPPEHWRSPQGQFIHIQSTQGHILVQIHPDGLEVLAQPSITPPIDILPLQPTDAMPTGNWQHHQHPNHTSSHTASATSHSTSSHNTASRTRCPSCGKPIRTIADRFCANCGQKLHFH